MDGNVILGMGVGMGSVWLCAGLGLSGTVWLGVSRYEIVLRGQR